MTATPKRKRSLTHVGGAITVEGEKDEAARLAHALDVPAATMEEDAPDRAHVHGFHTYPARMHPVTASRLAVAFAKERGTVLDPFAGSGTVLVEAMIAGRDAVGTDLNPLAVRLAALKTRVRTDAELDALVEAARAVAASADARRKAKAGASRRYPPEDVAAFDPHVLLELDGLRVAMAEIGQHEIKDALSLVLSAILVKLSKKEGDTSEKTAPRRLAAGYPARLFVKKTQDLVARLRAFAALLPSPAPRARVLLDDATRLQHVETRSIDAVITSPPYVATYDYLAHHAMRLRWLGIDPRPFERGEIGARRRYGALTPEDARHAWTRELESFLRAIARVVRPRAPIVLLMADSAVQRAPLRADAMVMDAAPRAGLVCVARAAQPRPHFHGPTAAAFKDAPRAEHAMLLEAP